MIPALLVVLAAHPPTSVVVYPDRAQVSRAVEISCGARVAVSFEDVPPSAVPDSFRAVVRQGSVDGLRAERVTKEKEYGAALDALRAKAEALKAKTDALKDELARATARARVGAALEHVTAQHVARELVADKPDLKAWRQAFEQATAAQLSSSRSTAQAELQLATLSVEEALVRHQLQTAQALGRREAWRVEVLASCPSGSSTVTLTYVVGGASWTPAYEARATGSGVELSLWATLQQTTGEPWDAVELALSTATPSQNATPPHLQTLMLHAWQQEDVRKVLTARAEAVEEARSGSVSTPAPQKPSLATRDQGLSVQLAVPSRSTVSGDGKAQRVFVGSASLAGAVSLRSTPKLLPAAFRVAELTNTAPWPLLPGVVEAYRGGGFVGRYTLEHVPKGGAFSLTFGLEETVRVKRTVTEELRRAEGLFQDKVRFRYGYRFELANYGKSAVELWLVDQVPVPEVDDVTVAISETTTPGFERNKADGRVTWKLKVAPQEKKPVRFDFVVDVPKSYDSGGL